MTELDMKLLELSASGYKMFQSVFLKLYEAFDRGKEVVILRSLMDSSCRRTMKEREEETAGLCYFDYTQTKRIISNLNLHGFIRVYRRKPKRPPNLEPHERVYSYLEVHPTEKGFKAYRKGDFCPIQPVKIYKDYPNKYTLTSDKIAIGKEYLGYEYLAKKYFNPVQEQLRIAESRWWKDWLPAFEELFLIKLCTLKEQEAKKEIRKLVDKLIPTLPMRRNSATIIKKQLEQSAKLTVFA